MDENMQFPSIEVMEQELQRLRRQHRRRARTVTVLCVTATLLAVLVLAASFFLPVVQVYGNAMEPAFGSGSVVVTLPCQDYAQGDVIAFYHNNTVQVRRVIASAGNLVEIDGDGRVTVNGVLLAEDYVPAPALGQCDISLPCQIPDGCYFVMGDNRAESVDSRSSVMGFVQQERIIGKLILQVWPQEWLQSFLKSE